MEMKVMSAMRPLARQEILATEPTLRVSRWTLEPETETGPHTHPVDYAVIPISGGQLMIEQDSGDSTFEMTAGVPYTRQAGTRHNLINIGDTVVIFIEVERVS
jgi:quercetin dioxygenase-like cupin family protein